MKNFDCIEINVIGLSTKKFYAEYVYSNHTQKIFISFEHTDKFRFLHCWISKLMQLITWDILFSKLSTLQGKNAGLIWFNFYLDFVAQNTIKSQPHRFHRT